MGAATVEQIDELLKQRAELDKQIRELEAGRRKEAMGRIEKIMDDAGISRSELMQHFKGDGQKKRRLAPKYRNPDNAKEMWSGRGSKPGWVKKALAGGKTLADLSV